MFSVALLLFVSVLFCLDEDCNPGWGIAVVRSGFWCFVLLKMVNGYVLFIGDWTIRSNSAWSKKKVNARYALHALRGQIKSEHGEVCWHLRDAQMTFLQSEPLISLATGCTGCDTNLERELDLTALIFEPNESEAAQSEDVGVLALAQGTQMPFASSSSRSQQMVVHSDAGTVEDVYGSVRHVNSSLDSALHNDDSETVEGFSDDGHSYAGTVVRGILRDDSE